MKDLSQDVTFCSSPNASQSLLASFHSINSLTPCRAYKIQRTPEANEMRPMEASQGSGGKEAWHSTSAKAGATTLPPASLTEHILPAWHGKWAGPRAYHLPVHSEAGIVRR